MRERYFLIVALLAVSFAFGENPATALGTPTNESSDGSSLKAVTTPSPLTVQHSLSFGMGTGFGSSGLQSQSFYNTMMQYKFSAPVTLNLNFGLPLYSSFSPYQNPSAKNIQSLDYFKNMPFDIGLNWKPSDNMNFNISIINRPYSGYGSYGGYGMNSGYGMFPWR